MNQAAVFLDRDNTIIDDPGYVADPNQVQLLSGAAEAIRRLNEAGYRVVVVTNQSGIARGLLTEDQLQDIHLQLKTLLEEQDARLDGIYYCPYLEGPEAIVPEYRRSSRLRKPAPGMLEQAAQELHLDLDYSWMIGDSLSDVQAGRAAGCRTILLGESKEVEDSDRPDHVARNLVAAADIILCGHNGHKPESPPAPGEQQDESTLPMNEQSAMVRSATQPAAQNHEPAEEPGGTPLRGADAHQPADAGPAFSAVETPPAATPEPAMTFATPELLPLRDDLQQLGRAVEDIRSRLARQQRDLAQPDFSLARLGATLFQFIAAALLLWGLFALIGQEGDAGLGIAVARFVLAGVVQLMALTLFILDRRPH
jgi:D-glycero-D-manno-heptose 1,7-bisphosphate phosphatase